jgi:anti-sigma-K factor RskA
MKKHEMEKKIEAALNSLDHAARVGPGPFFYTRVEARLNQKDRTVWERISGFIAQPAVALSVVCLVISLNTFVIVQAKTEPSFKEQSTTVLADDSDVDTIAFYDEENNNTATQ